MDPGHGQYPARRKHAPGPLREGPLDIPARGLTLVIVLLGGFYGLCMGCLALFTRESAPFAQGLASMLKVPALFLLTLFVTFPSLYVFNALVGSRLALITLLRLLIAALGGDPGGARLLWPHRRLLLAHDDKLFVHGLAQRPVVQHLRNIGVGVSAANLAPSDAPGYPRPGHCAAAARRCRDTSSTGCGSG